MTTLDASAAAALGTFARELAAEAGALALRRAREGVTVSATKSSSVDVVTAVDMEVEQWLRSRIAKARPNDAILGEEEGAGTGSSGLTWVIDPIDGTVNFLYGLDAWAVSIAVCEGPANPAEWTLVAGAVAAPAMGREWWAVAGQGAFADGRKLGARAALPLERTLVATGFGYTSDRRAIQGRIVAEILPEVRDIRRLGGCAIDLCLVADGTIDAYYEAGLNPWDMAAGELIITESGGRVLFLPEEPMIGVTLVAGHGGTEDLLAELVSTSCTRASRGV